MKFGTGLDGCFVFSLMLFMGFHLAIEIRKKGHSGLDYEKRWKKRMYENLSFLNAFIFLSKANFEKRALSDNSEMHSECCARVWLTSVGPFFLTFLYQFHQNTLKTAKIPHFFTFFVLFQVKERNLRVFLKKSALSDNRENPSQPVKVIFS